MKWKYFTFCIITLLNISCILNAQTFWNGSRYGMTIKEIQSLFPNSYTPEKPDTVKDNRSIGLLTLDEVLIDKESFKVDFFFNNERKLAQVNLTLNTKNSSLSMFDRFTMLLRSKYGQELSNKVDDLFAWKIYSAIWTSDKTNINLVYTISFEEPLLFSIIYSVDLFETTKKL
jgi:hypothetical protein